jgi:hypothetical protein
MDAEMCGRLHDMNEGSNTLVDNSRTRSCQITEL